MKKNNCPRCGREINKNYDFCPYCGASLDIENKWGMLGKNDAPNFQDNNFLKPDLFNGNILGKMLGSAMKMLEKELQKEMQNNSFSKNNPKSNFQLYINGKKVSFNEDKKREKQTREKIFAINPFSEKEQKKFSSLEKQEPETNVRRLADRIIFELKMPEVKSIKNISIKKLENSIEIKALTKNKAYYKIIQIGLPIINYKFNKEKLILELGIK